MGQKIGTLEQTFLYGKVHMAIDKETLETAVKLSKSVTNLSKNLNMVDSSGVLDYLRREILRHGIDTSHFTTKTYSTGKKHRYKDEELFVINPPILRRNRNGMLRKRFIAKGHPEICAICGQLPIHNDMPLKLQLDHINGINSDNREENLRFLCPNCHTQTATWGRKTEGKESNEEKNLD